MELLWNNDGKMQLFLAYEISGGIYAIYDAVESIK